MRNFTHGLLLLFVLFAVPGAICATGIKSVTLSAQTDDESPQIPVSADGWGDMQEIHGSVSTFLLKGYTATTEGSVSSVIMKAAIYKATSSPTDDNWSSDIEATKTADNTWTFDAGEGINLLEDLNDGETYILEFYFKASDGANDYLYTNGEQNFKVKFTVGEDDNWLIKLREGENAAGVELSVNGSKVKINYDSNFNRTVNGDIMALVSGVKTITLDYWYLHIDSKEYLEDASLNVSMQYRVYEQGTEGMWNGIPWYSKGAAGGSEAIHFFFASEKNLNIDLLKDLLPSKTYVAEVMYQVVYNDDWYMFGQNNANCRFTFTTPEDTGISEVQAAKAASAKLFNLQGVQVGKDYHGIVVQNGRKYVNK